MIKLMRCRKCGRRVIRWSWSSWPFCDYVCAQAFARNRSREEQQRFLRLVRELSSAERCGNNALADVLMVQIKEFI